MKNMASEFPVYQITTNAPGDGFFISIISMIVSLCATYREKVPPTIMKQKGVVFNVFSRRGIGT
jgi:hypothetical protein